MNKEEIKNYLIIFFVVVEILSMIFNYYFIKIHIGDIEYDFNFSIIFFCLGFFVVDIVADQFSPSVANKFIFYKLFGQILFLILGKLAVIVYSLYDTQIAAILSKSLWMIFAGLVSTYVGFYIMGSIMSYMKIGVYQGTSIFMRYLCSTIPGELAFSFIFTFLCFYTYSSLNELINAFLASALVKIILSILFAVTMNIILKSPDLIKYVKEYYIKIQIN